MLFASDLDNTLINSYKKANENDICVEIKDGKKLSFMIPENYELLKEIVGKCEFVPVTTRSLEQYRRIDLGFTPQYALVAHGSILLVKGKVDEKWIAETRQLIPKELPRIDSNELLYDIRNVDGFFIFGKTDNPAKAISFLSEMVEDDDFMICVVNNKFYVIPKCLTKGIAVERLKKRLGEPVVLSAGDSFLDISMLEDSEYSIFPDCLNIKEKMNHISINEEVFVKKMLQVAYKII